MILLRGIKGKRFAEDIERGVVGCRDLLSAAFSPPKTGYDYSAYLEKNLITAVTQCIGRTPEELWDPSVETSILLDFYLPYIYLSYFHILNPNSLNWLESFSDENNDTYFIAVDVELDELSRTAIGNCYFGTRMKYIDSIKTVNQDIPFLYTSAIICSIENLFANKLDSNEAVTIYNTLAFPLLHREIDSKYTDIENEFRIIAYDCPIFTRGKLLPFKRRTQITRDITLNFASGKKYHGILYPGKDYYLNEISYKSTNSKPKRLSRLLNEEDKLISLEPHFKSLNISGIASSCRFVGNKNECEKYIIKMLSRPQYDIYVNRTILKRYSFDELEDAVYAPCYTKIRY